MKKLTYLLLAIFLLLFVNGNILAQSEIYVSENGNNSNTGTINSPLATLRGACDKARSVGAKTIWIRGGRYNYDETCNLTSRDNGLKISGYKGEKVIFDGIRPIDQNKFRLVDNNLGGRIRNEVVGKVYSQVITDPSLIALLKNPDSRITLNDQAMGIARFPNIGFATVDNASVSTSSETPNSKGTISAPKGPKFKLASFYGINASKWQAEISRNKKVLMSGYISAVWLKENSLISNANGGFIQPVNGTRYGIEDRFRDKLKRIFFTNILYELDEPGEWYFDDKENRFFIYPIDPVIDGSTRIGLWAGPQLIEMVGVKDVTIEKLTIQNLGKGSSRDGAINVTGKSDNVKVAGIVFRNIAAPLLAMNFWNDVTNSGAKSCDFIDTAGSRLYGGKVGRTSITHGNNYIENSHFTQTNSKNSSGKACSIIGAGNKFINNIVHNTNGQPITYGGNDHVITRNEIFNIGVEEGDGGAIYTGNALWSYGNILKHNFIHHNLDFPGLNLGRASIFSDDNDSGDSILENIVYRGGSAGFTSSGVGHTVIGNIIMKSFIGIRAFTDQGGRTERSVKFYDDMMRFVNTDPLNNSKENYMGRMLKVTGVSGWQNGVTEDNWIDRIDPFWTERYPYFKFGMRQVFNDKSYRTFQFRIYENLFNGNRSDIVRNTAAGIRDNRTIDLSIFRNPSALNFAYSGTKPSYAPDIPFDTIGLYPDEYRCEVPDKDLYRRAVTSHFENRPNIIRDYNPTTANQAVYYNSGKAVLDLLTCSNNNPEDEIPIGKLISLRKSGGDLKYVRTDLVNNRLIADSNNDATNSEKYIVEIHPDGGIALKARSNGRYITVPNRSTEDAVRPQGVAKKAWEQFEWKSVGTQKVALKSMYTGRWLQAAWNENNGIIRAKGADSKSWETFNWKIETPTTETPVLGQNDFTKGEESIVSMYPNPVKDVLSIYFKEGFTNEVSVSIYNVLGGNLKTLKVNSKEASINVSNFPSGMYFIKIIQGKNSFQKTFIKE